MMIRSRSFRFEFTSADEPVRGRGLSYHHSRFGEVWETSMPVVDRDDLDRGVEALCEAYPKAFFPVGRMRRPLKKDIAADDISVDLREKPDSELIFYDVETVIGWYCGHVAIWSTAGLRGQSDSISMVNRRGKSPRPKRWLHDRNLKRFSR